MEYLCCCSDNAWRLRIWTHDSRSTKWLQSHFLEANWEIPEPLELEADVWLFENTAREIATDADPVIDVHLLWEGPRGKIWATLDGKETRLDNESDDTGGNELMRVASAEETFELGLSWFIAMNHLGCREPNEMAFWSKLTVATAYVVDDIRRWVDAKTPLVEINKAKKSWGVFVAFVGTSLRDMNEAIDSINSCYEIPHSGAGAYVCNAARVMIADGRVVE